jgi:hypothetical protein
MAFLSFKKIPNQNPNGDNEVLYQLAKKSTLKT